MSAIKTPISTQYKMWKRKQRRLDTTTECWWCKKKFPNQTAHLDHIREHIKGSSDV